MATKVCVKCGVEKDLEDFNRHPAGKMGRHPRCRACRKPEHHQYYQDNKDQWVERERQLREEDLDSFKKKAREAQERYRASPDNTIKLRYLQSRYGLTPEQYQEMERHQGGLCLICRRPPRGRWNRLHVDHDHKTGRVRGLLCHACNVMLGHAEDAPAVLERALFYLSQNQDQDSLTSSAL